MVVTRRREGKQAETRAFPTRARPLDNGNLVNENCFYHLDPRLCQAKAWKSHDSGFVSLPIHTGERE